MLNFRSINFILPTGVITLIVLVLGIFITHNINTQHNEITNAAINELKTKSARFSHATTRLLKIDKQFIRDELGYEASNPLLRTAAIIDSNNRIMFSTKFSHHNKNALSIISEFNQTDFKHARDNKTSVITISPGSNIVSILMNYTEPSNSHQIRSLNKGLVYFSYDISSKKNKIITSVFRDLMYEIIGMLFFGIILVITISKYITTPLTEIQNSAKNLAHGEFNLIETNSRLSEISDLTHVFNNMATELDENLKELTHQHQQTKAILDNVIDGIITIDNRGIIQSFNRSAEKISGHTANDIIGKNISLLMTGADKTNHDRYLKSYVDSNKTNVIGILREMEGQKKDGTLFPVDVVITEIKSNKDHLFIGMIRDITERKKVDQMKSEFISTVSHELRTPLTSLNGSIKLLSSGVTGQLNEQGNMLINNAKRNGERLLSLINDLLDMEKILAGKMQFEIERHNLQKIVSDSIETSIVPAYIRQILPRHCTQSRTSS